MLSLTPKNVRGTWTIQNHENTIPPESSAARRAVHGTNRPTPPEISATPANQVQNTASPGNHAGISEATNCVNRKCGFYRDVLGFEVTQRMGSEVAFLSAGGYHDHIGLNTWESRGGSPLPAGATGLYHLAILYPTRAALADALRRLRSAGIPLDGAADHGVSEALYLRDPDGNGVELYRDRPPAEWPWSADGGLATYTRRLDLEDLLRETDTKAT